MVIDADIARARPNSAAAFTVRNTVFSRRTVFICQPYFVTGRIDGKNKIVLFVIQRRTHIYRATPSITAAEVTDPNIIRLVISPILRMPFTGKPQRFSVGRNNRQPLRKRRINLYSQIFGVRYASRIHGFFYFRSGVECFIGRDTDSVDVVTARHGGRI